MKALPERSHSHCSTPPYAWVRHPQGLSLLRVGLPDYTEQALTYLYTVSVPAQGTGPACSKQILLNEGRNKQTPARVRVCSVMMSHLIFLQEFREVDFVQTCSKAWDCLRPLAGLQGRTWGGCGRWRHFHTNAQASLGGPCPWPSRWRQVGRASQSFQKDGRLQTRV